MITRPRMPARVLAAEQGFTLIEVMMAAVMLALVVSAAAALFVTGSDNSVAAERQSQLISVADQQIETIRQEVKTKGFAQLAMQTTPSALPSTIPNTSAFATLKADPNAFAVAKSGCGGASSNEEYNIEANYDNTADANGVSGQPENPSNTSISGVTSWSGCDAGSEPLEIIPSTSLAFVVPQQTVTVGTDTAIVDTYVTDTYVGCSTVGSTACPSVNGSGTLQSNTCTFPTVSTPGSTLCADARRVIVAVVLNDHGRYTLGPSAPVYVSTVFTNPTPANEPTSSIGITLGAQLG
jgi:prepilin-type N-terminal cleavage/methylation domain-containing protein